jgi:3',5'-cyclic AMP phosphodiesterase CpdA
MFRLAHFSDIHLGPLPAVTYRELASKRITGYINWRRYRRHHMQDGIAERLIADLRRKPHDHIAVTGDLVNLALDGEIEMARLWMEALGSYEDVTLVPGNHDAYVPGALDKACHAWGGWMSGDGATHPMERHSFPFLRRRGPLALIGVSSARATAPFMASGQFSGDQADRLEDLLDLAGREHFFRVVLIHHPPVRGATAYHKRLFGITRFQEAVRRHGAELVLHGHTHLPTTHWIAGRDGPVPVVGVAAAGQATGSAKPAAQYNYFEIDERRNKWLVCLTRRGITGPTLEMETIASEEFSVRRREGAAARRTAS